MIYSNLVKTMINCSAAFLVIAAVCAILPINAAAKGTWKLTEPIVTFIPGPPVTDQSAKLMKDGGWNLVWCTTTQELETAHKFGLKAILYDEKLNPNIVDDPAKVSEAVELVNKVKNYPAMDMYFVADEPNVSRFASIKKMVDLINKHDPAHLGYVNLYPTYCSSEGLGTKGDIFTAYQEYLDRYIAETKPLLLSYDNYQFFVGGDGAHYFLNLELIRKASLKHNIPFINVIQASSWVPDVRVPTADELRFLTYTSVAYGAKGISHYCYWRYAPEYKGMMVDDNGNPTHLYHAAKNVNPEFVSIATELMQTTSLGAYHVGMVPLGAVGLPANAPFRVVSSDNQGEKTKTYEMGKPVQGFVLGYFGNKQNHKPTHAVIVNLDYNKSVKAVIAGPAKLEVFIPGTRSWYPAYSNTASVDLLPGGGVLVRLAEKS